MNKIITLLSVAIFATGCRESALNKGYELDSDKIKINETKKYEQEKPIDTMTVIEVLPAPCEKVVHIGDSTSVGLITLKNKEDRIDYQYKKLGIKKVYFESDGGRSLHEHSRGNESGPMVARRIKRTGFSGCWVIALGTNDAANIARSPRVSALKRIDKIMSIIDGDPVMWVDLKTIKTKGYYSNNSMKLFNFELEQSLEKYPNMKIYKWSEDVKDQWFTKDGIHNSVKGKIQRSKLIPEALMNQKGNI